MSTNNLIIEGLTRHQIMIQRLGSGNYKKLEPILERMARDVNRRILDSPTDFQLVRLQSLLTEINLIMDEAGAAYDDELFSLIEEFSEYEAEFTQKIVSPLIKIPTILPPVEQITAALTVTPAQLVSGKRVQSLTIKQMVRQFTQGKQREVDSLIRAGFIEGKTSQQIARDVQSLLGIKAPRQAATLVRTATNHAGSVARKEFYRANSDVIGHEEWVSTLDGRTTFVCMSRDGERYEIDQGPWPPAHYGCRSLRVPVIKPEFSIFGNGKGKRASKDGPVSAQLTYSGFLKQQSKEFQEDVLGVERSKLFRSGKVTLDGFVDDMGRTLTLDELRQREGITI
jgi:SPP1 gp7 family putative phage head morphogenesis protein